MSRAHAALNDLDAKTVHIVEEFHLPRRRHRAIDSRADVINDLDTSGIDHGEWYPSLLATGSYRVSTSARRTRDRGICSARFEPRKVVSTLDAASWLTAKESSVDQLKHDNTPQNHKRENGPDDHSFDDISISGVGGEHGRELNG